MTEQAQDWPHVSLFVLKELERLGDSIERMDTQSRRDNQSVVTELTALKAEVSAIKVKAGFYGALSGLGTGMLMYVTSLFGGHMGGHT